jgi:hypothetical protein
MERLGNVIYWIGCVAAGITLVGGAFEAVSGAFHSPLVFSDHCSYRGDNVAGGMGLPVFLF